MELPSSKHLPCAELFENSSQPWQRLFLIIIHINVSVHKLAVCTQTSDLHYESLAYITRIIQTGKNGNSLLTYYLAKILFSKAYISTSWVPYTLLLSYTMWNSNGFGFSSYPRMHLEWDFFYPLQDYTAVELELFVVREQPLPRSIYGIGQMSSAFSRAPLDK